MAYTATVSFDQPKPMTIGQGLGIITGTVTISAYHQTTAEITGITKKFDTVYSVIVNGVNAVSSVGYVGEWNSTDKTIEVFRADTGAEAANDLNAGTFNILVIGSRPGKSG